MQKTMKRFDVLSKSSRSINLRYRSFSSEISTSPREGLPRWANLNSPTGLLRSLDYFGTIVFASSGALTAAMSQSDLLGSVMIGTITAVGGGTLRDTLVLNKQPFWTEEWEYLVMSAIAASATFFCWDQIQKSDDHIRSQAGGEGKLMFWGDAIGVGAFTVIGAMNGIRAGCPALVSALCGMMTATFGGLTRDTLLNRPVRILHPYSDMYAPIAFFGALSYLGMRRLSLPTQGLRIFSAIAFTIGLRYGAMTNGWRLPWWDLETQTVVSGRKDPRTTP